MHNGKNISYKDFRTKGKYLKIKPRSKPRSRMHARTHAHTHVYTFIRISNIERGILQTGIKISLEKIKKISIIVNRSFLRSERRQGARGCPMKIDYNEFNFSSDWGQLFSNGPNRVGVSLPSPEDGNRFSFRNVLISSPYYGIMHPVARVIKVC
jgi:hypothetical protein